MSAPLTARTHKEARVSALKRVFRLFDLDGNGSIAKAELFSLAVARRTLGQKQGEVS